MNGRAEAGDSLKAGLIETAKSFSIEKEAENLYPIATLQNKYREQT